MAVFENVYSIINSMYQQTTGKTDLTAVDTSSFVSVANTVLQTGYDSFMNALSNVLIKTLFAWRPYTEKFSIIEADAQRFGNHVRKISNIDDMNASEEESYNLTDGASLDPWIINKPKVVQFNYYDKKGYKRWKSIPVTQIDTAVENESQFAQFIAMIMGELRNRVAQDRENAKRLTFNNYITAVYQDATQNPNGAKERVVNLLAEYNTATGLSLTTSTVYQPTNYMPFIQWAAARIKSTSDHMTERGYLYHKNVTDMSIPRHTPKEYQRFVLMSDAYNMIESSAFSNTFHDRYVSGFGGFEAINFLQSDKDGYRDKVSLSSFVTIADATGAPYVAPSGTYELEGFFGAIFDRDAMLVTTVDERMYSTPVNPRGLYSNLWYHYAFRYCNDLTENCVIFVIQDTAQNGLEGGGT